MKLNLNIPHLHFVIANNADEIILDLDVKDYKLATDINGLISASHIIKRLVTQWRHEGEREFAQHLATTDAIRHPTPPSKPDPNSKPNGEDKTTRT
jgi:DNA primase